MSISRLCGAIVLCSLLAGCANYTKPVVVAEPASVSEQNFESVWQAAQDVLFTHRFRVERMDRREGLIVTEPMVGQQAWEFWRRDAATPYALAESTLHTIYRQASIRIVPAEGGVNTYQATVQVSTYRSSRSRPEVTSVSGAYSMFLTPGGNSDKDATAILGYERTLEGLADEPAAGEPVGQLVSLGDDPALAANLARRINERAAKLGPLAAR